MNLRPTLKLKHFALPIGLFLALLLTTAPAFAGTPINKTVAAAANGNVQISSVAGSIKVTAWNRKHIHVSGTLSSDAKRLAIDKTAAGVAIRVILPQHTQRHFEGSHLVVQLPAASHLHMNTVSANVSAFGPTGPLKLQTVSGDIKLRSKSPDISAKTVTGDIDIAGSAPQAKINAQSISGKVQIHDVGGALHAETVSGGISLGTARPITRAKLDTTSGNMEFVAALATDGNYKFHSISGDVSLRLPSIPAASFDASSLSGDITTNFGPAPQRTSKYGPGKEWRYQNGSGKAEVRIRTLSGDIEIHASKH